VQNIYFRGHFARTHRHTPRTDGCTETNKNFFSPKIYMVSQKNNILDFWS